MANYDDDDAREFTGTTNTVKASPKSVAVKPVAPVKPLAAELAQPEPKKPGSHLKFAVVRPAKEYEAAKLETEAAQREYRDASTAFKIAEAAESAAVQAWCLLNPPPDADAVYRAHVARSQAARAANVAAGKPAGGVRPVTHDNSPLSVAAAHRGRQSPQMASTPLRSPVARRNVV